MEDALPRAVSDAFLPLSVGVLLAVHHDAACAAGRGHFHDEGRPFAGAGLAHLGCQAQVARGALLFVEVHAVEYVAREGLGGNEVGERVLREDAREEVGAVARDAHAHLVVEILAAVLVLHRRERMVGVDVDGYLVVVVAEACVARYLVVLAEFGHGNIGGLGLHGVAGRLFFLLAASAAPAQGEQRNDGQVRYFFHLVDWF